LLSLHFGLADARSLETLTLNYPAGKAEVSRKHANVIVNLGGAASADVLGLVRKVAGVVEKNTGLRLETEIDIVGEELS